MKYSLENCLSDFEFHDSEWSFNSYEYNNLSVTAKHLNIHNGIKENPYDYDMEIKSAVITFKNIEFHSFEPMRAYDVDEYGNLHTDEPRIVYGGDKSRERLIEVLNSGITINGFETQQKNGRTIFDFSTAGKVNFFALISFDSCIIEWDEYSQKAWYELHRQYNYEITLETPSGEQRTDIAIICHEEDMYYQGKLETAPIVTVGIKYEEQTIWGLGKDYFWIDAFADLQKKLPENVKLKCCLVCKHGNMCPAGNCRNEVFCTKDVLITEKSDLFFYTEDAEECNKRSRKYVDICESFENQNEIDFTYNDWLYELNK